MTAEELRELINREIDGDLSPSEKRRLAQATRRNPQARRLQAELKQVHTALASVRAVEPPSHLAGRISAEVRARAAASASASAHAREAVERRASWLGSLGGVVFGKSMVRYGTVFAGGLVVGALAFMLLAHPEPAPSVPGNSAMGTLLAQSESFPVNVPGAQGTVTAVPTETGKELTLRLICSSATTTRLVYDPSRVKLENLSELQSAGGPVAVNNGVVEISGTGAQKCTLLFSGVKDSKLSVQIASTAGGSFHAEVQVH
ncbi:MAG TPA: hypothetical protein VL221_04930 [Bacteroidota bacterium]|nr:hypothetical protein [Bacteroidota bacterium]